MIWAIALSALLFVGQSWAAEPKPLIHFDDLPQWSGGGSRYGENLRWTCGGRDGHDRDHACRDTVSAVLDTLNLVERVYPSAPRVICPPVEPLDWTDAADIYLEWLERNPSGEKGPGAWGVVLALREFYPCPEEGS